MYGASCAPYVSNKMLKHDAALAYTQIKRLGRYLDLLDGGGQGG